ncbi:vesicular glutamate transporter 1-like [Adelges cooleyi]|uniref:vesicular glutamate transporter 1-like n=1 Tax=Adelges cooleyi TaxID=133065 RepID=UPI00217F7B1F|nr:vesicular glutamate transporter 1-like [Adelges cooleyi]
MLKRTILWYMTFWGFAMNYMLRMNLNIAIVSMVRSVPKIENTTAPVSECYDTLDPPSKKFLNSSISKILKPVDNDNTFEWDENLQNEVLGAFYWLHTVLQIPGGILAQKYSAAFIFGVTNGIVALLTCIIPYTTQCHYKVLVTIRIIQGFIAGASWPAMHALTGQWVPPNERSQFVSSYWGCSFGTALTYIVCGYIINWFGWELVFYITGAIGLLWYACWTWLIYDSPAKHPSIKDKERMHIEKSLGTTYLKNQTSSIPWKSMCISVPLISNIVSQIGSTWGMYTLSIQAPTYFRFVLGFDLKQVGIWTGIPHLFSWLFSLVCGYGCDFLIKSNMLSTTNVRKLACIFCNIVQGLFILGLAYSGCSYTLAIINLVFAVAMNGAMSSGPLAGIVDLAPNYAGIMQGIGGVISMGATSVSPAIVGFFTYQRQTIGQWQKVFILSTSLSWITGLIYLVFGSSNLQKWNSKEKKKKSETATML